MRNIKNILVVTSSIDRTVDYMIEKYCDYPVSFKRLNTDLLADYGFNISKSHWCISNGKWDKPLHEGDIDSIYYRKPKFPDLSSFYDEYKGMISRDIIGMINGIVDSFEKKVLTKPSILRKCENKTFQLLIAEKNGFNLPNSFIGTDETAAKYYDFKKSIIKPLTTGKIDTGKNTEVFQTNYFEKLEDDISVTPIYLQEYIEKDYEVRVTIANNSCFPVKIQSNNQLDWRKFDAKNTYSIIEIPKNIKNSCYDMLKSFDLSFGAFDFIVTPEGKWIFLELNPNGQWHWLELELGLKISDEIVKFLFE